MKKLFLPLTSMLLALTLAACAADETLVFNDGQQDIDTSLSEPTEGAADAEADKPAAEITMNDNETSATVSSPQAASEDNVSADANSAYPINITPSGLNAPLPTMTLECFNDAGEYEYTIQNDTPFEWGYGLEPYFDKYDDEQGVWLPVEPITEIAVIEIYCMLPSGGSCTYCLPIDQYYGDLSAGSYRVGLLMRNHETETSEMVWFEFSIGIDESYWRNI